ncbi:MAG TPA: glycosyltransferase family 4 protein [Spirochaetota bacterium]|nr:glycosyltransferase family 4 protein [Spirochaetota bacterium]HNT12499.1 glycosyltransferase family 4 protein [Spirochaetota bacterium]
MRALFLCYRGNPFCGGQGIYLYHLTRELAALGVEIDVIVGPPYPDPLEGWADVYKTENLNIWSIRTRHFGPDKLQRVLSPWNFVDYFLTRMHVFGEMETFSGRAFFKLRDLLRTRRYDIIHDVQCLGWGLVPMRGYGIPIVTTVHHPLTRDRVADFTHDKSFWELMTTVLFYPLTMQRFVINRLDRVITSSTEGAEELGRAFGVRRDRISVVYNGMDVEMFRNDGSEREPDTLLFVGNTEDHKKGLIYLFEAMTLLPERITLTIVDEGPPVRTSAFNMIKRFGIEDRVRFTGKVSLDRLVNLYSSKAVLVMSSLYEGFGLPAAEAMACETPVVVTAVGSLPEVVAHNETGLIVPPENPRALADAIMMVLKDKKLQRSMGKKGRMRTVENFAWPVAAQNTLAVYEDVIRAYRRAS